MRCRGSLVFLLLAACGADPATSPVRSYSFGPFDVAPDQEISDECVQITLHNDTDIYVNKVALTTGGAFHHSNWDFVPAEDPAHGVVGVFPGPDGVFKCADRNFDQAVGALKGGTLFAQSTQASHDVQEFPPGAALKIPKGSKLVSTIHLLNATDNPVHLEPKIELTTIPQKDVTTLLAAMAFEDHALGLPPQKQSRFSVTCDLQPEWNILYGQGTVDAPSPDFSVYYALAHYHVLGTGMTVEMVRPDGTATTMYSVDQQIGDSLGQTLDPPFSMTGYSQVRFTCDYTNTTDQTITWGLGSEEMCVFLAFTDSTYLWGGGAVNDSDPPGDATLVGNVMAYSHACDIVTAQDSTH
jgi:hypothetical protein